MADDHQQDADETARNRAALEDYDRAQNMRDRHGDAQFVERTRNLSGNAAQVSTQDSDREQVSPQGRDQHGSLSPLQLGGASRQPATPQFATDTVAALAAVSQAMQAVAANIGQRSANNSRHRDGEIVINKDISQVFEQVPEDVLDRVKYVESVVNRLNANTSGVRFKTDSEVIQSIRLIDDKTVLANHKMYTFKNVDIVVPFAVVFSDAGRASWSSISISGYFEM